MEDKNLTAVEWLEAIIKHCERFGTNIEQKDIEEAKAMEKEQIIDDYFQGVCDESDSHGAQSLNMKDAEKYYNAKYGK